MSKKPVTKAHLVVYDKETLAFLKEVSHMARKMCLRVQTDDVNVVHVSHANDAKSVVYSLSFDKSHLTFKGPTLAFYDFHEFCQLVDTFGTAQIEQEDVNLLLSENNTRVRYRLGDAANFEEPADKRIPKTLPMPVKFTLQEKDVRDFRKMIGLMDGHEIRVEANAKGVTLTLTKEKSDNTFERTFSLVEPSTDVYVFNTSADIIEQIPLGGYTFGITKNGNTHIVKASLNSKVHRFDAYTGELVTY